MKPAEERIALEPHTDALTQPARRREPGFAHRSKAFLAPALRPTGEVPGKAFEQHRRGNAGDAICRKGGRGEFDILRCEDDIDADPDHDEIDPVARARLRFEEDTGELPAIGEEVVGPFVTQREGGSDERPERVAEPERGDKAELRRAGRRGVGPQYQRQIEIARRRPPEPAAPSTPGGLFVSPYQRPIGGAGTGQRLRLVVGAADRGVMMEAKAFGQGRGRVAHRANNDAAAASAPPTIGSGNRMKNIVSTAVTTSTHLSSGAIGRSNDRSGSSKYITLTMRR